MTRDELIEANPIFKRAPEAAWELAKTQVCICGQALRHYIYNDCMDCAQRACVLRTGGEISFTIRGANAVARVTNIGRCEVCHDTRMIGGRKDGKNISRKCKGGDIQNVHNIALFNSAMVPGNLAEASFDTFEHRTQGLGKAAKDLATWCRLVKPGEGGVRFRGTNGVGKTHLAVSIIKVLTINRGIPCLFRSWPDVVAQSKDAMDRKEKQSDIFRPMERVPVLVLDELGYAADTNWKCEGLMRVIDSRYRAGLTTIFTTNFTINELKEVIGSRGASRIESMTNEQHLVGTDHRRGSDRIDNDVLGF